MLIKLRVHPGSKKNAVERMAPDHFEVWVKAPAKNGLANRAVLELMGAELSVPAKRIRLIKGGSSPSKIIEVPI
ncbi:MAG: hypothetical protein AUJ52_13295 [Elusimicrobia bacterium CG1_02_63_36]|nr:MAG: hypothetical protein AUJ52_13295 [Elusimicrobia bacterium CG1_02_63_36]PIP83581.1 MAG: hypothetical protein COR54_09010 [Elusimicrobia bacterium CG22_combo_CG10-13_8_21_14_all_63_91]PJA13161.1 MAG: hypothetical protein COX66_15855 [Elusimicrobia bacterium CG_4_10_14_0_2_um_filter_63_34]PJB26086.1 MAG: hypothetical protein CO113_05610 [Elusimicrobia bacterium CG_4_9_14_3_um_filter_62_55]